MNKKLFPLFIIPTFLLSACNFLTPLDSESELTPSSSENSSSQGPVEVQFSISKAVFLDKEGHLKVNYLCNYASPFNVTNHIFSKLTITGVNVSELNYSNPGYFTLLSPIISESLKFEFYDTNNAVYISYRCEDVLLYDDSPSETIEYPEGYDTLYWSDEFDGNSLDTSKWTYEIGNGSWGWGNGEAEYYTNSNDTVSDGVLTIQARKQNIDTFNYTSTRIKTQNKVRFTYGYVEARISLPKVTGMWPAFWMMPNDSFYGGWPHSGEIDIMEAKGRIGNQSSSAIHFSKTNGDHKYLSNAKDGHDIGNFHKYAVEWLEDSISFYIDDICHATYEKDQWSTQGATENERAPFDKDFYIILNLAVGGTFDGYNEPPAGFTSADMKIDYVRVFKK